MNQADQLTHLHFPRLGVRGAYVDLRSSLADLPGYSNYPEQAQSYLGQALVAAALLHANVKGKSRISLQLQSESTLRLLFAECREQGQLRGLLRLEDGNDAPALLNLGAGALMAITLEASTSIDQRRAGPRYQGLVPLIGTRLDQALEEYFLSSEQLPTRIVLAAGPNRACGLLLQKMPDAELGTEPLDTDGWTRSSLLLGTLSGEELLECSRETVLHRLFHDEQLLAIKGLDLAFACTCSQERVESMFRALGRDEALAAASEGAAAEVRCEFCSREYRLDRIDLEALFHPLVGPAAALRQ